MSQEDVEVVRRFEETMVAAIEAESSGAQGDFAAIFELVHEDIVIHGAPSLPHGAKRVGHKGFIELGESFGANWKFIETPTFTYRDAGDVVLLHATFRLESLTSGQQVPVDMIELHRVKDGKIIELTPFYRDTVPESAAAGMCTIISTAE